MAMCYLFIIQLIKKIFAKHTDYWTQASKPLVIYRFYCIALYHSEPQRHVIKKTTNGDLP